MTTKNEQDIQSDIVIPDNFTMLPNMAIQELDATSFKLLAIYINTARQNSKCWKANQTVADELGCGIVKMKRARKTLEQMRYISFVPGTSTARAIVTIRYTDMWKRNSEYRGGGIQNEYPSGVSEMDTNKDSLKATKTKDSLSSKSTKGSAPTASISDTKKKISRPSDQAREIRERLGIDEPKGDANPEIDWQAKILNVLDNSYVSSYFLEQELGIGDGQLSPLTFSKHPAAIALWALEAERKVEYMPMTDNQPRQWRLHPDYGGPAPKSDFDVMTADELKPAIPEKVVDSSKLTKAQRDAWYDAVHDVFGESAGLNGKYQKLCRGEFSEKSKKGKSEGDWFEYQLSANSGLTPDLLRQWGSQYKHDHPDMDMFKEPIKVQSALITFLEARKKPSETTYLAPYHKRHVVEEVILSEEEQLAASKFMEENNPFKDQKASGQ